MLLTIASLSIMLSNSEIYVEDQTLLKGTDRWIHSNPLPTSGLNYKAINDSHKVLVANLDSGVDYNQPFLREHIHYTLNDKNDVVGVGYDYLGEDDWAAPYIGRTEDINSELGVGNREFSRNEMEILKLFVDHFSEVEKFFHPKRSPLTEINSRANHGTRVGGMMVYDFPEVGLIPYRIIPVGILTKKQQILPQDEYQVYSDRLQDAIRRARDQNVRVINISITWKLQKLIRNANVNEIKKYQAFAEQLADLITGSPQILFVVALGNETQWFDQQTNWILPCGLESANLICVGSLEEDGSVASFNNTLYTNTKLFFVPGVQILSPTVSGICETSHLSLSELTRFSASIYKDCLNAPQLSPDDGNSLSSPILARLAAKYFLEHPDWTGNQVALAIENSSEKISFGNTFVRRVPVEMPSWYFSHGGNVHQKWQ